MLMLNSLAGLFIPQETKGRREAKRFVIGECIRVDCCLLMCNRHFGFHDCFCSHGNPELVVLCIYIKIVKYNHAFERVMTLVLILGLFISNLRDLFF